MCVARVREKLWSASDRRPTKLREHVHQRRFVAPESRRFDLCPTFHGAADPHLHAPDRHRLSGVRSVLQPVEFFAPDFQNLDAAVASRHADYRNHVARGPDPDRDLDNDHHDDSDANADPAGSNSTDTSKHRCRMRSRLRTPPARAATNCACERNDCAEPRPSSYCDRPNGHSDKAPIQMARLRSTSNHKADTTPNYHNDTAPNRCSR